MKFLSGSIHSKIFLSTFACGMLISLHAADQNIAYFDGKETKTMGVDSATFTPTHPDSCSEKKKAKTEATVVPTPIAKAPIALEQDSDADGVVDSKDKCPDTLKGYQVDVDGCPKSVTLHMNFAFASNLIPTSAAQDVINLTNFMKNNPASKITIIGHTDIIGNDERNQPRSEARARALGDRLIANGIDGARIQTAGKGSKEPIATNNTDAGRAQNRRIEVEIR